MGDTGQVSQPQEDQVEFVEFLKDMTALTAFFAAAGYVVVRPAFDGFYGALGLRPEDVGINEAQMLSLGSVLGLFYGAALILAVSVPYLLYWSLGGLRPPVRLIAAVGLLVGGWLLMEHTGVYVHGLTDASAGNFLRYFRIEIIAALFIVGAISILSAIGLFPARFKWRISSQQRRKARIRALTALLVAVLVTAVWGRFVSASAGRDLLTRTSTFSADHPNFVLLLIATAPPVYVIPTAGDKMGLCVRRKDGPLTDIYLLGRGDGGAFVLAFQQNGEESNGRIVFLSSADYGIVFTGDPFAGPFGGCHNRGVYNDPPFP